MEDGFRCPSFQVERRLARLAAATDPRSLDYLLGVIRDGSWHSGSSAAPAFAGLRSRLSSAQEGLVAILKKGSIDAQRHAIEALGYLGANDLAFEIAEFASITNGYLRNEDFWTPVSTIWRSFITLPCGRWFA
jgi:hypothetical protein